MKTLNDYKEDLTAIFTAAVNRVNPESMILNLCQNSEGIFRINISGECLEYKLDNYKRIIVIGAGKATARMAKAIETLLGDRISDGLIAVKYGHTEKLSRIRTIESGHPVPDDNSIRAADEILALAKTAGEDSLVINLVSGGGSALLCSPFRAEGISCGLEDKQAATRLLLECGAGISEINTIRKHLSGIKGGRLAEAIFPAESISLILSDVIGDRLDSIASGLTVADPSTYSDAFRVAEKYGISRQLPEPVREILQNGIEGRLPETPGPGSEIFSRSRNILIGTNLEALKSAETEAGRLGYNTQILSSQITGEASEIANFYLGIGLDIKRDLGMLPRPACIIAGGETTVTLRGKGLGGRNQEMALSFLRGLAEVAPLSAEGENAPQILFLSGGTDGNDGPTDAAGAFAYLELADARTAAGLGIDEYLADNDSYSYFKKTGGLLMTGPTNTNVCDVQIMLVV